MSRNFVSSCLCRYESINRFYAHEGLYKDRITFSWTGLGFERIDIKSKVLSMFKMNLIRGMQVGTLKFIRAVIVITALLLLIGQGMEGPFIYVVIIWAFLS